MWQDPAIAVTVTVFTLSVIPMVYAKTNVPVSTSLIMTVGALVLTICYWTMGAWFSVLAEVVATLLWGILLVRGLRLLYLGRKLRKKLAKDRNQRLVILP